MTTDYKPWERNELNKNSQGGTEVMVEGMLSRVDPQLLQNFQIIPSRMYSAAAPVASQLV